MATLLKALLALLLLACVCTVYGHEEDARKEDICTQGLVAVDVFMESRGCTGLQNDPSPIMNELMRSLDHEVTVDTLRYVFTNYCSTVMPRFRQCFEGNIQNCSADQQRSLMRIAQQTGFLCQPYTTSINAQVQHILTKLSDADLAVSRSCFDESIRGMRRVCLNRSLIAMGVPSGGDVRRLFENLTMEELAPKAQAFVSTMMECTVTHIRDNTGRCEQWRGLALRAVDFIFWPVLSTNMTFTNEDIDRMFEWNSPARRDDTGGLGDFMQLSEEWP